MARTGRPRSKVKRTAILKTTVYGADLDAFKAACVRAKVKPADMLRDLAERWNEYVAENPRPSLHFRIVARD